jgi:hypothetical protein
MKMTHHLSQHILPELLTALGLFAVGWLLPEHSNHGQGLVTRCEQKHLKHLTAIIISASVLPRSQKSRHNLRAVIKLRRR